MDSGVHPLNRISITSLSHACEASGLQKFNLAFPRDNPIWRECGSALNR